jgi:hypothetical protein
MWKDFLGHYLFLHGTQNDGLGKISRMIFRNLEGKVFLIAVGV